MASANSSPGTTDVLRRRFPAFAFGLGVACLLGMVPVTLGALAGYLSLAAAVPVLGAAMAVSMLSLVLS